MGVRLSLRLDTGSISDTEHVMIVRRLTLRIERSGQSIRLTRIQNAVAYMAEWMSSITGTRSKPPKANYKESEWKYFQVCPSILVLVVSYMQCIFRLHRSNVIGTLRQTVTTMWTLVFCQLLHGSDGTTLALPQSCMHCTITSRITALYNIVSD